MITTQQEFAEVREVPALEMNGVSWRVGRHTVLSDVSVPGTECWAPPEIGSSPVSSGPLFPDHLG